MPHSASRNWSERRADVDALRVGALLLLLVYHVLLVYNSWDWWRVKSEHAGQWADYFTGILTPWRMALVFLVGGIAARFMLERSRTFAFIGERASKLLTAFCFAVIVLIPLQRFVRMDESGAAPTSYLEFMLHQARYAVSEYGVWLPDFAHAWFLPYLFAYSALAALIWRAAPRTLQSLQTMLERAPLWAVAGTMAWFAIVETIVLPQFPVSGLLFTDVGAHAKFAPAFMIGMLIGKSRSFTEGLLKRKYALWLISLALLALSLALKGNALEFRIPQELRAFEWLVVRGAYGGIMIYGALAFAAFALNKPSPALTYATDAILPVYLMHQTVLIITADYIVEAGAPLALEFTALLAATALIPLALYHLLVRRTPWLRVLFGLRAHARADSPIERADPPPMLAPR